MSISSQQKTDLTIQKGIRRAEEDLVIWIQDALDSSEYPRDGRDKLEESQFRNLVRVSDTTESPEVVKNFIRYQVGRERKWGRGKKSLAERIINDIDDKIKKKAKEISADLSDANVSEIHINLIRRYLGYGARYLKYLNDGQK
jgi:hypothetical protein